MLILALILIGAYLLAGGLGVVIALAALIIASALD